MNYLFSRSAGKAFAELLERLAQARSRVLLAFDYDGTLAPIVSDPMRATPRRATIQLMDELLDRHAAGAVVISGRSVANLRDILPFEVKLLIGNHGLEGAHLDPASERALKAKLAAKVAKWLPTIRGALLSAGAAAEGIELENKTYSLSLHYRHARSRPRARRVIADLLEALRPAAHVIGGKMVFNVMPDSRINKGTALRALMKRLGAQHAFFIGDDTTDEDVFALGDPRIFGVRVGLSRASAAPYYVRAQSEVDRVLLALSRGGLRG